MDGNGSVIANPDIGNKKEKRKRSGLKKKSLAAENEQRQKFLNALLNCESLPINIKEILKQEVPYFHLITLELSRAFYD